MSSAFHPPLSPSPPRTITFISNEAQTALMFSLATSLARQLVKKSTTSSATATNGGVSRGSMEHQSSHLGARNEAEILKDAHTWVQTMRIAVGE